MKLEVFLPVVDDAHDLFLQLLAEIVGHMKDSENCMLFNIKCTNFKENEVKSYVYVKGRIVVIKSAVKIIIFHFNPDFLFI